MVNKLVSENFMLCLASCFQRDKRGTKAGPIETKRDKSVSRSSLYSSIGWLTTARNHAHIVTDDAKNCFEVLPACLRYITGFVCGTIHDRITHRFRSNVAEASTVNCSCFDQNNPEKACSIGHVLRTKDPLWDTLKSTYTWIPLPSLCGKMPLESYAIGKVIGKGSYGEVCLVKHRKDRKQVRFYSSLQKIVGFDFSGL